MAFNDGVGGRKLQNRFTELYPVISDTRKYNKIKTKTNISGSLVIATEQQAPIGNDRTTCLKRLRIN